MFPPESDKDKGRDFTRWIKIIWLPVIALMGATTAVVQFIQLWRGDRETVTLVTAGLGYLVLIVILLNIGFSITVLPIQLLKSRPLRSPRYPKLFIPARIGLGLAILLVIIAGWTLYQQDITSQSKVVILIANFDGPNPQNYRVTEQVLSQLHESLNNFDDIVIRPLGEANTEQEGSEHALELGRRYHSTLVIWGWYGTTGSDVLLTIHIENPSPAKHLSLSGSAMYSIQAPIAEIESFQIQQRLAEQMTALTFVVSGLARYEANDFSEAVRRLDGALDLGNWSEIPLSKAAIYFYRGNSYMHEEKYSQAIEDFSSVIQINPQLEAAYYNRGLSYYLLALSESINKQILSQDASAKIDNALADFKQTLAINPRYFNAYESRASLYMILGKNQEAIDDYTIIINSNPEVNGWTYHGRGNVYFLLGDYEKALADFEQAIRVTRGVQSLSGFYSDRGRVYAEMGDKQKAINDYNKAIQLDPESFGAYQDRGNAYSGLGNYEQAISDYSKGILISVANHISPYIHYFSRGVAYSKIGEYQKAIDDFSQVVLFNPEDGEAYYKRGEAYAALGDSQKSENDFSQAAKIYYDQALFAIDAGAYQKAIDGLTQVISIKPTRDAYYERGVAYSLMDNDQKAIDDFTEAIRLDSQFAYAFYVRGKIYLNLKNYQQAIADFSQAIQINQEFAKAYLARGKAYANVNNDQQAIRDFTQALNIAPRYIDAYIGRALFNAKIGEYQKAVDDLSQAIQIDPQYPEAYYDRGLIYKLLKDNQNAIADFRKTLEISSDPSLRKNAEDQLKQIGATP